jgi:hypothetical protein
MIPFIPTEPELNCQNRVKDQLSIDQTESTNQSARVGSRQIEADGYAGIGCFVWFFFK